MGLGFRAEGPEDLLEGTDSLVLTAACNLPQPLSSQRLWVAAPLGGQWATLLLVRPHCEAAGPP